MDPIVEVTEGKLRGSVGKDLRDNSYYSFKGIPYAKPPFGEFRFKAPQPLEKWEGVRDALEHGGSCRGRDKFDRSKFTGGEDCLYLNVHTPSLSNDNKLLPVMFYIHGGAFTEGNGNSDLYGPKFLLPEKVVLVTINYRYGALGFMAFKDPKIGVPGNAGLKDMVMALKWVQNNIKSFNGNPNNVTIFGESAGSASVHYLVLSPMAKGLFHKAICQSGTANTDWAFGEPNPLKLAKALGVESTDERAFYEYLKTLPFEDFTDVEDKLLKVHDITNGITPLWGPTKEVLCDSEEPFLTEDPKDVLKSGKYNDVPIIFGYTSGEGLIFISPQFPKQLTFPMDFTDNETIVPLFLNLKRKTDKSKEVGKRLKEFFYGDSKPTADEIDPYVKLTTDVAILIPKYLAVKKHAELQKNPVYFYRFAVDTPFGMFKKIFGVDRPGTIHADDLSYLFSCEFNPNVADENSLEGKTIQRLVKLWTSFAKTGVPKSPELNEWKPVAKTQLNYLDIGDTLECKTNPDYDRLGFWDDIVKLSQK